MQNLPLGAIAALMGLAVGIVMGLAARFGGFGTLSAIRSVWEFGDQRRVRLWGIVVGVAIIATYALDSFGLVRLAATPYHANLWSPFGAVLGGVAFGYGMALAGNCGFEALVRAGAGDLKALIISTLIGITAMAVGAGPLAPLFHAVFPQVPTDLPEGIASAIGNEIGLSPFFFAVVIAGFCIAAGLNHAPLRQSPSRLAWGVAVGLAVAASLAGTTWLYEQSLGRLAVDGPSFAAPLGQALLALMLPPDVGLTFGAGLVAGVLVGAVLGAVVRGFHRDHPDEAPVALGRITGGAALMGIGGAVAGGDVIGQGLTATATLAWSGPVTLLAILGGCWLGRKWLVEPTPDADCTQYGPEAEAG